MAASAELTECPTTILCMDDDDAALRARSALLEAEGYRVFAAATADAAKRWFVAEEIDLVVSACQLHGVSGADLSIFMKQLRAGVAAILLLDKVQPPSAILEQVDGFAQRNGAAADLLVCVTRVLEERSAVELQRA